MGAEVSLDSRTLTVAGDGRPSGIDVDLHDAAELTPVVAALAACADGPSIIRGVAHIRGHETDRLTALARELGALGAQVTAADLGSGDGSLAEGVALRQADVTALAGRLAGVAGAAVLVRRRAQA